MKYYLLIFGLLLVCFLFLPAAATVLEFQQIIIDKDAIGHREVGDVNRDGKNDIVAVNQGENENSSLLVWYRYPDWKKFIIANTAQFGDFSKYRSCDMEIADIDGDGDLDVIGRIGPPSAKRNAEGMNCWFENPLPKENPEKVEWIKHDIGEGAYAKDLEVRDINGDRRLDLFSRAHDELYIFIHQGQNWDKITVNIHAIEGMEVADLDRDGDPDAVLNGYWIETPENLTEDKWIEHTIDEKWYNQTERKPNEKGILNCCKVTLADMNKDGCLDVIISHSERIDYPVSWYEAPADPRYGEWKEHVIGQIDKCHSLKVADFDIDGDLDVFVGEMPNLEEEAPYQVGIFLNQGNSMEWIFQEIHKMGCYSGQIGDVDNDGDIDLVGLRNHNQPTIEVWRNPASEKKLPLNKWTYFQIDDQRERSFGLGLGDCTNDGFADIVSGEWFYRNPGGNMSGKWERIVIQEGLDASLVVNIDDDEFGDIIAFSCNRQYWCEAQDGLGKEWHVKQIGNLPVCNHKISTQGYNLAQIIPGGKPEIIFTGEGIFCFQIPPNPVSDNWPVIRITPAKNSGEWISAGDMDGDGDLDVCAGYRQDKVANGVAWWENPSNLSNDWSMHLIGMTSFHADKFLPADINGDDLVDVVVTEERYPGRNPDASLFWYEQFPERQQLYWKEHLVVTQYSMNSGDVGDVDRDGDIDIVVCEHRMPSYRGEEVPRSERLQIWENDGKGNFTEHVIDRGKESHLGARLFDMDKDGDLDIVSIAWRDYQYMHLWRNDAISR
jgi:hypothetical protein